MKMFLLGFYCCGVLLLASAGLIMDSLYGQLVVTCNAGEGLNLLVWPLVVLWLVLKLLSMPG